MCTCTGGYTRADGGTGVCVCTCAAGGIGACVCMCAGRETGECVCTCMQVETQVCVCVQMCRWKDIWKLTSTIVLYYFQVKQEAPGSARINSWLGPENRDCRKASMPPVNLHGRWISGLCYSLLRKNFSTDPISLAYANALLLIRTSDCLLLPQCLLLRHHFSFLMDIFLLCLLHSEHLSGMSLPH